MSQPDPTPVPLLDLKTQFAALKPEIMEAVEKVLDSQFCIGGPAVENFEAQAAEYCGTKHAIAISSGTDALLCALMACDLQLGDEVIAPPFTFFATTGSIHRSGAKIVFADIDPVSFNIDPEDIERKITSKTRAIMPVHLFGQIANMDAIMDIAEKYGLRVIEDAAQAIGSQQHGRKAGSIGDFGCFSFFPSKNLGGAGDGGLITTNDDDLAKRCLLLRNHGAQQRYYHDEVGANFRLDAIQCAYLSVKLRHIEQWHTQRRENAARYGELLADVSEVQLPVTCEGNTHIYNQFTLRCQKRDELHAYLNERKIGNAVYYPLCLHEQKCFDYLGYKKGDFPVSEHASTEVLSLPIFPELADEQIQIVAGAIREFYGR